MLHSKAIVDQGQLGVMAFQHCKVNILILFLNPYCSDENVVYDNPDSTLCSL